MNLRMISSLVLIIVILFELVAPVLFLGISVVEAADTGASYYAAVVITEQSGANLTDYAVRIELNPFTFDAWQYILYENGSDIYFTLPNGTPLFYWIESFNKSKQQGIIWVKVPSIPANSETIIYMYFGGDNPYTSYNNGSEVFTYFDDFSTDTSANYELRGAYFNGVTPSMSISNGVATLSISTIGHGIAVATAVSVSDKFCVMARARDLDVADNSQVGVMIHGSSEEFMFRMIDYDSNSIFRIDFYRFISGGETKLWAKDIITDTDWHIYELCYYNGAFYLYRDHELQTTYSQSLADPSYNPAMMVGSDAGSKAEFDYLIVRPYVDPEPSVSIGMIEMVRALILPAESLYLEHQLVYSPNSTQFTHGFSATNTTAAGYETDYTSPYGWRVYANPYNSTENNASLVSEVNITLPYTSVLVENITLYAKTNGTGNYRQLWIKVLNSTGGVVAELTNATIGTGWTEVTLTVNANLSNQITIWINATVKSTTTAGEEIGIKDVRVYIEYETNPQVTVPWSPNVEFFNCSASHYVELGSSEYLNSSIIVFKLIQYLTYNTTDYPVQPMYVGNETIGSYNYSVYRVDPANYSQSMTIYALLENRFKTFRTHAKGYDTETILIGEPLTVELPELGNITIVELNKTFINVTSVTISFSSTGTFTVEANLTQTPQWRLGYGRKVITVKYGAFSVRPVDVDSRAVDYEDVVLQLINKTDGSIVRELTGNKLFSLTGLWAGNYSMVIKFKDITIGVGDFELNITTDASIIDLQCAMKSLARDYRGFNRTVVHELDKQLVSVEDLSIKYPFSRMRILLNGTGPFKLYINYRGDLPTKVVVEGNVTGLKYYWDGDYLVIEGSLGSIGELNITDLYKVRLEIYDRLGNLMPSWMFAFINGIKYSGAIVEDYFYPEDYVVKLPATINGFEFYSFFDGFDENVRAVSINNSDITLRAWYRVPTSIEVRSYQVASLWWLPFVEQDSDRVKVYIEGYLRDYYGTAMPDRLITINVTDVDAGFTWSINVTTDATGYFRTPLLELVRGRTYRIDAVYSGDDIYVGSSNTIEVKPEELPTAPVAFEIPVNYLLAAVGIALIAIGIFAAIRAARHTIEDIRERTRRFVRRKR